MLKTIELFLAKLQFPKTIIDEWFAYQAIKHYEIGHRLTKYKQYKDKEQLPPYFDEYGNYIGYKIGDIVPLRVLGNYKAFYKITDFRTQFGDNAMWDDAKKYNLKLHHIERI